MKWWEKDKVSEPNQWWQGDKTAVLDEPMFRTTPDPTLQNDPNDAYFGLEDPNEIKKRAGEILINTDNLNISLSDSEEYQKSLERLEKKKPIGFLGGLTEDALFKIPISGPMLEGLDLARLKLAAIRLNDPDFDWEKESEREKRRLDWEYGKPGLISMSRQEYIDRRKAITAESARQDDIDNVSGYINAMAKREERGYNFWGTVGQGVSVLPAWMFEFALTGGLYRSGSAPVKKILQKHAKSKLLAKTGGWIAGSTVRTTIGMPQRVFANTMRRSLNQDEGWATSIAKGWGETFIEVASEQAGETITGGLSYVASGTITKMPFGSKFLSALQKSWVKLSPNNTAAKFAKKIATKAGYSNLLGEYGEERFATLLHGIAGTQTFGLPEGADTFDRVLAGVKQDLQLSNALSEVVVLSVPGAIKVSVGQLGRFANDSMLQKAIQEKVGVSPEAAKKAIEIKNDKGVEEADKYLSAVKTIGEAAAEKVIAESGVETELEPPPTEGVQEPQIAPERLSVPGGVKLPPGAEIAQPEGKYELSTPEGRKQASISITARAKEIASKLGFNVSDDELLTMVYEGKHTRGTSHGDAGISLFLAKDATQENIDRVLIHELGHTMKPTTVKGLSNQYEYEKEARKFEEEQYAKLKELEAQPPTEAEPTKVEGKKTLAEIKKETPAERKYFTDLLLNERERIIEEAKGFIDQFGPDILVQDFQPRINEIDKDLRRRGYNPTRLPKLGPEIKKAIAKGWVPVKAKEKLKAEEVKPKGRPSKIGFPKDVEKIELPTEPTAKEPVSARQIITHLSKALKVPYASMATHRPRAAAGWYEIKPVGIRQINVRDLDTAAHEVGHHIDHFYKIRQAGISRAGQKTWKMPEGTAKGTAAELVRLGKMLYGERKPPGGYKSEGIAEYIRGYLTGHLNIEKEAPKFHKWFTEDYLPNNPEVATGLENARGLLTDYRLQGAEARIESQINTKEIKGSLGDRAKAANLWFQQMFVDEFAPLRKGIEEAGIERKELKPTDDPYELAVYFTQKEGARARQMVLFGTIDLWGNKTGKGLKEIMKPIADENAVRPFTHFVVATRSLNLWKRGINPGISKEDAQHVYDTYKDNEGWQETAKEITEWNHRVLNYLVEAGALPKETADKMIEANPIYVPFLRAFAKGEKRFGGGGAGAGLITTKKGVFAIKGSGREIIDPFESMITQTRRMIAIAHKSVIARSLANLEAKHRGLAGLIWKVPAPKKATTFRAEQAIKQLQKMGVEVTGEGLPEPGEMMEGRPQVYDALMTIYGNSPIYLGKENIIAIVQEGKKSWYEVSPDMYKLLQGLDKFYMPRVIDVVFGKAGRAMRLGATGLNASFGLVRNPIRDMQDTIFKGTHARGPGATVKGVAKDLSRLGLAKSMGIESSKAAEAFVAQGGQISGFIGQDRKSLQHLKGEMLASSVGRYSIHTVKHPIDAMREVFGVAETGPRIQEYEKALEYGEKKYGKGSPDAKVYAFNKAQDQTINYSRHGVIGKWLNQMIPFWNANAQDISKVNRTFRERGKVATAYATAFLTLPALGLWWYNKDEEWYKEVPAWEKANYLHVKIPGKDSIVRIPVPFLVGHIFQSFPVTIVDALYNADKFKVTEFFKEVLEADVYSLTEWPAIISPVIDVLQNKDWAERPIVPKSVEGKLPSDQYKEYTTEFAKSIGKVLNMSPAQIEHLMNSWSGGLYRRVATTAEMAVGRREKELTTVDIPVIGKLFVRDPYAPKASIEKFYEKMDNLDRKYQSEKILSKEMLVRAKLNRASRELAEIWKELREEKTTKGRERLYGQVEEIIKEAGEPMTITEIRSEIRENTYEKTMRRSDGTIGLLGQPHKGKEKYVEALKKELRK